MSGWLPLSKKSAERRCVSRLAFLVSMDAAPTRTVPLTSPSAETVPFPLTSRKTPLTGTTPMDLLFSRMLDVRGSRTHSPARAPSASRARTPGAVDCPDSACMIVSLSHRTDLRCHLYDTVGVLPWAATATPVPAPTASATTAVAVSPSTCLCCGRGGSGTGYSPYGYCAN